MGLSPSGNSYNNKRKGCSLASRNSASRPGSMRKTIELEGVLKRSTSLNYGYKIPSLVNDQNIKRENFPMTLLNRQNTIYHMWITNDPVFKDYGNLKKSRKASETKSRSRAEVNKSTDPAPEVVREPRLESIFLFLKNIRVKQRCNLELGTTKIVHPANPGDPEPIWQQIPLQIRGQGVKTQKPYVLGIPKAQPPYPDQFSEPIHDHTLRLIPVIPFPLTSTKGQNQNPRIF